LTGPRYKHTYVGWVNSQGDIMLGGFDHKRLSVLNEVVVKHRFQKDDHSNPSLMILEDGRIIIFYSQHCGNTMYFKISRVPEDISSLGKGNF